MGGGGAGVSTVMRNRGGGGIGPPGGGGKGRKQQPLGLEARRDVALDRRRGHWGPGPAARKSSGDFSVHKVVFVKREAGPLGRGSRRDWEERPVTALGWAASRQDVPELQEAHGTRAGRCPAKSARLPSEAPALGRWELPRIPSPPSGARPGCAS